MYGILNVESQFQPFLPAGDGRFFSIEWKAHSPCVWMAGERWPSGGQGQPHLSLTAALVNEQSLDLGLLQVESHFGHGHLEKKYISFPQEEKHGAPVLQGRIEVTTRG